MSREKVEKYKDYKKNKKEILAKEKRKLRIEKLTLTLAAVIMIGAISGGIGLSVYNGYKRGLALRPNYDREQLVINDMSSILAEEIIESETSETAE